MNSKITEILTIVNQDHDHKIMFKYSKQANTKSVMKHYKKFKNGNYKNTSPFFFNQKIEIPICENGDTFMFINTKILINLSTQYLFIDLCTGLQEQNQDN